MKQFVPSSGAIVIEAGGTPLRLQRDETGEVTITEVVEKPKREGGGRTFHETITQTASEYTGMFRGRSRGLGGAMPRKRTFRSFKTVSVRGCAPAALGPWLAQGSWQRRHGA